MKRSEKCVNSKIKHTFFKNDSLVFQFENLNVYQNGENHVGPWHVYTNPHEPNLCANLSFSRYIFTYLQLLVEVSPLFEWTNQYARYAKLLMTLIKDNMDELMTMGVGEGGFGTHSLRRGGATIFAAEYTFFPPTVLICIFTGWDIGGVKYKIFQGMYRVSIFWPVLLWVGPSIAYLFSLSSLFWLQLIWQSWWDKDKKV